VSTGRATLHAELGTFCHSEDGRRVRHSGLRAETTGITRCRALSDTALIVAMRDGTPEAWFEFDARFRPLLEHYARRIGIPRWDASVCITEVLDDEALVLVDGSRGVPQHLSAYLVRALRNRFLQLKRSAERRRRHHVSAAKSAAEREGVLIELVSEYARRAGEPPRIAEESTTGVGAIARFARLLDARLTGTERQMLAWVGESVPHRVIAEWLGITRDAAKKRIARLCRRLRAATDEIREQLAPDERREVDLLLRRAGASRRVTHSGGTDDG
jgi:DNA-directed RNA polymerase specialized sigma24 family protein